MSTDKQTGPLVGILIGSKSDRPVFDSAVALCKKLELPFELVVRSAHRTPVETAAYIRGAEERGVKVFIAAAGMAAHLAGAVAAQTTLPVIGVPIAASPVQGFDALLATVQMPPGMPVATVAINGAKNAVYLAAQIIAASDPALRERIDNDRASTKATILSQPGESWPE